MPIFSRTVRNYVKSREGKKFLEQHFEFSNFQPPSLGAPLTFPGGVNVNIVGTAFDALLPLLVFRKNKKRIDSKIPAFHWISSKERRDFIKTGDLRDTLLDGAIKFATASHKSFTLNSAVQRPRPNQDIRQSLRLLFEKADSLVWTATRISNRAALSQFGIVDLLLDTTAIEVKTVKDAAHHFEHSAQLLAYFLLSQLPVVKERGVIIEKLGIYYARHGILVTIPVSELCRSEEQNMNSLSAEFLESFIRWTVDKGCDEYRPGLKQEFREQEMRLSGFSAGLIPGQFARKSP